MSNSALNHQDIENIIDEIKESGNLERILESLSRAEEEEARKATARRIEQEGLM